MPISHELLMIAGLIVAVQIASTVVLWRLGRRKGREKPAADGVRRRQWWRA